MKENKRTCLALSCVFFVVCGGAAGSLLFPSLCFRTRGEKQKRGPQRSRQCTRPGASQSSLVLLDQSDLRTGPPLLEDLSTIIADHDAPPPPPPLLNPENGRRLEVGGTRMEMRLERASRKGQAPLKAVRLCRASPTGSIRTTALAALSPVPVPPVPSSTRPILSVHPPGGRRNTGPAQRLECTRPAASSRHQHHDNALGQRTGPPVLEAFSKCSKITHPPTSFLIENPEKGGRLDV